MTPPPLAPYCLGANPPDPNSTSNPFDLRAPDSVFPPNSFFPTRPLPSPLPFMRQTRPICPPRPPLIAMLRTMQPPSATLLSRMTATLVLEKFPLLKHPPVSIPVWPTTDGATRQLRTTFSPLRTLLCLDPPRLQQPTPDICGSGVKNMRRQIL